MRQENGGNKTKRNRREGKTETREVREGGKERGKQGRDCR